MNLNKGMWNGYPFVGCVGTNESVLIAVVIAASNNGSHLKGEIMVISLTAVALSMLVWSPTETELPQLPLNDSNNYTVTDFEDELQRSLKQDPNQSDLWFKLGGVYMQKGSLMRHSLATISRFASRSSKRLLASMLPKQPHFIILALKRWVMMLMRCWSLHAAWSQWSYGIDVDCDKSLHQHALSTSDR